MHQEHEGLLNQRSLLHQGVQHAKQMLQSHRDASKTFKTEHEDYLQKASERVSKMSAEQLINMQQLRSKLADRMSKGTIST